MTETVDVSSLSAQQICDRILNGDVVRIGEKRLESFASPVNANTLAEITVDSVEEVHATVGRAVAASKSWAQSSPATKAGVLQRWAGSLRQAKEPLARVLTLETGKRLSESLGEVDRAASEIDFMVGETLRISGKSYPSSAPDTLVVSTREPIGVVAAITPWNFPVVAPIRKIAPAVAYGDGVVLKPSSQSPLSALIVTKLLVEAGAPEGLVTCVTGGSSTGALLVDNHCVDGISFTGSTGAGRAIAQQAGARLVPVQLELGGKNAAYVDVSARISQAADEILAAATGASGQRCTAISRVLVHDDVADELIGVLSERVDKLVVGSPFDETTDVGPMISISHADQVRGHISVAIEAGAVQTTGRAIGHCGVSVPPVVLDNVDSSMDIALTEVFGPVVAIIRVSGVDEAIDVANASEYGLAASVFATNTDVALRFRRGVNSGMVHVNHGTASQAHVPFGGVSASGLGAYSIGDTGVEFFTQLKVTYLRG